MKLTLNSNAKINLTLKVLGKRSDGFHELETIMQSVSLHDTLTFNGTRSGISITCSDPLIPVNENNICHKAASLLIEKHRIRTGIQIDILKNIPSQAGLGGGSLNAAATLVALNKIWGLNLTQNELISYAGQLGSDVAFFIVGGRALCKGRGEIIEKMPSIEEHYIIVKPDVSVSTKWAYDQFDKTSSSQLLVRSSFEMQNDLEPLAINKYPVIGEIKNDLIVAGCNSSQMTGSGSAVFGVLGDTVDADNIFKKIKAKYVNSFLVKSMW